MRTLVLNSTNLVQDGQNNKMVYNFPNSVFFKDDYISVAQISMYYSWFNITSDLQNNIFTYNWTSGGTTTTYTITVPNGLYEITTLNELLQFNMIANGHYLVNAGSNVYYAEFIVNPSRYAVQINTYLVPTSLPSGYTNPASLVFPTQTFNPVITLPANINKIMGYVVNFATNANTNNSFPTPTNNPYVSKLANGTISYISTTAPNLQPNSSILFSISNINNEYAQPSSIIYALTPNVAIGEIVNEKPPSYSWNALINGTYNQLRLTILGTDLNPIIINDPNITILLVIKNKSESG